MGWLKNGFLLLAGLWLLGDTYCDSTRAVLNATFPLRQQVLLDPPHQLNDRSPSPGATASPSPFPSLPSAFGNHASSTPRFTFNSEQFDQQFQRYQRFVFRVGPPDILIVGSSRALQGVDPVVLQHTLANRGYPNLSIFNFGVNGATAQLVDLILQKLLTPDQWPRLILWADGVRAFNSGRIDITYNHAIASQGYKLLVAGARPPISALPIEQPCSALALKLFALEPTDQPRYFGFLSLTEWGFVKQRWCWQGVKRLPPEILTGSKSQPTDDLPENTGFQSVSAQFEPVAYFQRYPKVAGDYDADYRNFSLEGRQTDAFHSTLKFAQVHHIPVVFVNLPLTQIYRDETRTAYERQFQAYLQRHARSHGLIVYDLGQQWPNRNDYFMDPSHLNRRGAAAVAEQVGRLLPISQMRAKAP